MKKFFAIAACAVLFAGCDFLGGSDAVVASVANITITDAALGNAPAIRVEVQDVAGRAYATSTHANVALPLELDTQFDIHSGARDLFIVVIQDNGTGSFSPSDVLGVSDSFDGDLLAASAGSSVQVSGAVSAEISVAGPSAAE